MPVQSAMTWNAKQRRWFKKYKGKVHCISAKQLSEKVGCVATMRGSTTAANDWWENKKLEIDAANLSAPDALANVALALNSAIRERKRALQIGDSHSAETLSRAIAEYQTRIENGDASDFAEFDAESGEFVNISQSRVLPVALGRLTELMKQLAQAHETVLKLKPKAATVHDGDTSIKAVVASYLKTRRIDADNGRLSPLQYRMLGMRLNHFAKSIGESHDVNSVTGQMLVSYRETLISDDRGDYHVNDFFSAAKRFLK